MSLHSKILQKHLNIKSSTVKNVFLVLWWSKARALKNLSRNPIFSSQKVIRAFTNLNLSVEDKISAKSERNDGLHHRKEELRFKKAQEREREAH